MTVRLLSTTLLLILATSSTIATGQAVGPGLDRAISVFEKALPQGWSVAERKPNDFPWGHHFCDDYAGPKGTKVVVVGPKPVQVAWMSRSGESLSTPVAKESLEVWFMPPEYKDNWSSWLCFHRPVQPIAVLKGPSVSVFGRPSHRLTQKQNFVNCFRKHKR